MRSVAAASMLALGRALPAQAHAVDFRKLDPDRVGRLLAAEGLPIRRYHADNLGHGGGSNWVEIGNGSPLPNNLAYYLTGDARHVKKVKLILNINDRRTERAALALLEDAAVAFAKRGAGGRLPRNVREAIVSAKDAREDRKGFSFVVDRTDWPTGKGYDVTVEIE